MISWIVASHDETILTEVLLASLDPPPGDELIVIRGAASIAAAYNEGAAKAARPVRCYVHHDVRILDLPRLRGLLVEHCAPDIGMVGVIGSRTPTVPWWDGPLIGSVVDTRHGFGALGPGGNGPCAYLDGLLLATLQPVVWDEAYPGWHLYDHDVCQQMLARDLPNWCLPDGHGLVRHESTGRRNPERIPHWAENVARFHAKWDTGRGA